MAICRSDTARAIRAAVSMPQAAQHYGLHPNRAGFVCCPFHSEKTPSFKIYDNGFCCFGCGKKGSVIDFAMDLFGLSFRDALTRLDQDFNLGLTEHQADPEEIRIRKRQQIRAKAKKDAEQREYLRMLEEHRRCYAIIENGAPDENGEIPDELANAIKRMSELEYYFETHNAAGGVNFG